MSWNPEKEVPSLELCKKLRELGYPQDGGGLYWNTREGRIAIIRPWKSFKAPKHFVKAPTCRELGECLPSFVHEAKDEKQKYRIGNANLVDDPWFESDTEPNVRAEMLIWLVENGCVKFFVLRRDKDDDS